MTLRTQFWVLGILCGVLLVAQSCTRATLWERHNAAGLTSYEQGYYGEAEEHWEAALKVAENFGPQDPRLATSLNNLAELYRAQGWSADAEPLYQRALAIDEKALGSDHPDVATDLNNLAALYQAQGRYAEAAPLHQRALAIWEKALGPEHPNVAQSLENYSALLRETGRDAEAGKLEARAKAIRAKYAQENPVR